MDAVTALNEMRAAQTLASRPSPYGDSDLRTARLWRVWDMREKPPVRPTERRASGQDVDMEGDGEILHIEARPADGERALTIDKQTDSSTGGLPRACPSRIVWRDMAPARSSSP